MEYHFQTKPPVSTSPTPTLLTLPLELRLHICEYLFQTDDLGCRKLEFLGSYCADNISRANIQLFTELRPLRLKFARFVFKNPVSCLRLLEHIGKDTTYLRNIAITFSKAEKERLLFQEIFTKFKDHNQLRDLQLEIMDEDGSKVASSDEAPVYCPSALKQSPALAYDLSLRPSKHPLGNLKFLRSLTVIGHPGTGEIEEALFKLSRMIDGVAKEEGKVLETQQTDLPCDTWFYRVAVEEKFEQKNRQPCCGDRCKALAFVEQAFAPGRHEQVGVNVLSLDHTSWFSWK